MIDVAIAIDGEAVNVTLTTTAAGSYNDDGDFIQGAPTSATIRAAIQPVKGNQLMDMPEGIRTEAGWMLWSRSAVAVDDQIISGGIVYRILFAWPRLEGGFYRAALGRLTK
ncbi:hypothetical protein [Rhizobium sp. F40D2]|uniref:hypothetical protein n=1 Tax=Rhizobium sp. F40D2 TaxID=3453141 RepID=UPI003F240521